MVKVSSGSPLRYPGGKFRARKILEEYVPRGTSHILSPFLGGGSFELHMTKKNVKVSAYDGFYLLANFWQELISHPPQLADLCEKDLGKITAVDFKKMQKELQGHTAGKADLTRSGDDNLSLAHKFFVVNRCSFSGATLSGGFSQESASSRFTQSIVNRVRGWDNPLLSVEYALFEDSLANVNKSVDLLFLDPPYLLEDKKNKLYGIGGNMHTTFDHEKFKDCVVNTGKPFLLTYNNAEPIREIWGEFTINDAQWSYGMNTSKKSSEIIITNY